MLVEFVYFLSPVPAAVPPIFEHIVSLKYQYKYMINFILTINLSQIGNYAGEVISNDV